MVASSRVAIRRASLERTGKLLKPDIDCQRLWRSALRTGVRKEPGRRRLGQQIAVLQ